MTYEFGILVRFDVTPPHWAGTPAEPTAAVVEALIKGDLDIVELHVSLKKLVVDVRVPVETEPQVLERLRVRLAAVVDAVWRAHGGMGSDPREGA